MRSYSPLDYTVKMMVGSQEHEGIPDPLSPDNLAEASLGNHANGAP